jgi:hypothetical protein
MWRTRRRASPIIAVLATLGLALTTGTGLAGAAAPIPPPDRPGPPLTARAELRCSGSLAGASRAPVLLNPATGVTPEQNYSWNWERSLSAAGIPWCAYTAPRSTLGDVQVSGELLVDAIRRMHAESGRRIAILGHSQGGMSMRWALRFFPDTRAMVDDVIGFAPSNHGTTLVSVAGCRQAGCTPASIQQASDSRFIAVLNSGAETFHGISYTSIYSATDEVVLPPPSAALRTGDGRIANIATQDVCPTDLFEHLTVGTVSGTAYALAMDALDHDGPADPRRIPPTTCVLAPLHPGVDVTNLQTLLQPLSALPGLLSVPVPGISLVPGVPLVKTEPALRCYATVAGCAGQHRPGGETPTDDGGGTDAGGGPGTDGGAGPRCVAARRTTVRLPRSWRRATATVAGRRAAVRRRSGRLTVTVDLRPRPGRTVRLVARGTTRAGKAVRHTRTFRVCARI